MQALITEVAVQLLSKLPSNDMYANDTQWYFMMFFMNMNPVFL